MQSESFLSHQLRLEEGQGTSNCQTLFGMENIPTDNHIRMMLDPVHPRHLQGSFDDVIDTVQCQKDVLRKFQFSLKMTMDIYGHLWVNPAADKEIAAVTEQAFA